MPAALQGADRRHARAGALTKITKKVALAAATATACGILAVPAAATAVTVTHAAHASPACAVPQATKRHNPGGNGREYRNIPNGIYAWVFTYTPPLQTSNGQVDGYIYAGKGNLKNNRTRWIRHWKRFVDDGVGTFSWHVLTRDWDTAKHGDIPHGLTPEEVRTAAEQLAIDGFKKWVPGSGGYILDNKQLNLLGSYPKHKQKLMRATANDLYENQLENNARAGNGAGDGDILNYGGDVPSGAMAELPGDIHFEESLSC